jgi:hypothetical protein
MLTFARDGTRHPSTSGRHGLPLWIRPRLARAPVSIRSMGPLRRPGLMAPASHSPGDHQGQRQPPRLRRPTRAFTRGGQRTLAPRTMTSPCRPRAGCCARPSLMRCSLGRGSPPRNPRHLADPGAAASSAFATLRGRSVPPTSSLRLHCALPPLRKTNETADLPGPRITGPSYGNAR